MESQDLFRSFPDSYTEKDFRERSFRVVFEDSLLAGYEVEPLRPAATWFIYCPPFAEEHKYSYRIMVDCLRDSAARGFGSMRFDYRGSGESGGDERDIEPAEMVEDILEIRRRCCDEHRDPKIVYLGLRMGANLALAALQQRPEDRAILFEPLAGIRHHLEDLYRKRMLQLWMAGRKEERTSLAQKLENAEWTDVGDSVVGRRLFRASYDFDREWRGALDSKGLHGKFRVVRAVWRNPGKRAEAMSVDENLFLQQPMDLVTCKPFWSRVGLYPREGLLSTFLCNLLNRL